LCQKNAVNKKTIVGTKALREITCEGHARMLSSNFFRPQSAAA
jgi:hypothetical protein